MLFKQISKLLDVLVLFLFGYIVFEGGLSFLDFRYHTYNGNVLVTLINSSSILLLLILAMFLYYKYLNSKKINFSVSFIFILVSIMLLIYRPNMVNMLIPQKLFESLFNILNFICYLTIVIIFISGIFKLFTFKFIDKPCNLNKNVATSFYCVLISGIYAVVVYLKEGIYLDGDFLSDLYVFNYLFTPLIITSIIFILSLFKLNKSIVVISILLFIYVIFCSVVFGIHGVYEFKFPKSTCELLFMSLVLIFLGVYLINISISSIKMLK